MSIAFNFNTAINGEINQTEGRRKYICKTVDVQVPVGENSKATALSFLITPNHPAIQVNSIIHEVIHFTALPVDFHPFIVEISGILQSTLNYLDESAVTRVESIDTPFTQNISIPGARGPHLTPEVAIYILSINQDFKEDPHLFSGIRIWVEATLNFTVQALQMRRLLEQKK